MLADFALTQYTELEDERIQRLDILIQVVKNKSQRLIQNQEEQFMQEWCEISEVMVRAKRLLAKLEYFKDDNCFPKDMYELKDPVSQLCTLSEAQDIVFDAENHLILANSVLIRDIKTTIASSIEFHTRFKGPHWHKIEAAKRYISNMMKGGFLAD